MNINAETFLSQNPQIDINRSRFDMSHDHKFTGNIGELIPIEVQEVLAGDTFEYKTHRVIRMMPLVTPPMDDIFLDEYWFYCPTRILWDHYKGFMGENLNGPYYPTTDYVVPQLSFKSIDQNYNYDSTQPLSADNPPYWVTFGAALGSIADHMGIPVLGNTWPGDLTPNSTLSPNYATDYDFEVNALPFRAYAMICNEFFRSESLQNPLNIYLGDATRSGANDPNQVNNYDNYVISTSVGGHPFRANKVFDFFTACLPLPQRNAEPIMAVPQQFVYFGDPRTHTDVINDHSPQSLIVDNSSSSFAGYLGLNGSFTSSITTMQPNNWVIDGTSVNDIRVAFQVQKFYESLNRSGGRYRSVLQQLFGVTSPDASLQIPQFLGSSRTYFNIGTVLQTSETGNTPLGSFAGTSHTSSSDYDFIQSFSEPGYIIGVAVARYSHSYESSLDRLWQRRDFFDFYNPLFANIGEMPVNNNQIFAQPYPINMDHDANGVFGYNEAWADYRYQIDKVSGFFRSQAGALSFDNWTFTDQYSRVPQLGDKWIMEDPTNINRILNFQYPTYPQFFCDFQFEVKATRPMPVHSIPGLVDHH